VVWVRSPSLTINGQSAVAEGSFENVTLGAAGAGGVHGAGGPSPGNPAGAGPDGLDGIPGVAYGIVAVP